MEKQTHFLCPLIILFSFGAEVVAAEKKVGSHGLHRHFVPRHQRIQYGSAKLFVFGDSYADTGNTPGDLSKAWKEPYGISFPGEPTGRFSNGRVLTDYVAEFLGIESPVPSEWGNKAKNSGLNFAHGGTGVFNTSLAGPNMTAQIDSFQQVLGANFYKQEDLNSSAALVSVAGNDYSTYIATNGTLNDLPAFTEALIQQLVANLKRINSLGVRKIAITEIEPLGCLPEATAITSHQRCIGYMNTAAKFHNKRLRKSVEILNKESDQKSPFVLLNLHKSFWSVVKKPHNKRGSKFDDPLTPCCAGVNDATSCGSVDDKGVKQYTVCEHPELAFFWDDVHPTQSGWSLVFSDLHSSLRGLFH